jgi:hypothetical protein
MEWLSASAKILPFLDQYPVWVRASTAAWLLLTASLVGVLVMVPRTEPALKMGVTGDNVIDEVESKLASLKSLGQVPEAKLAETIAPLFSRPAFYGIREENWNYFLFTLCRTRLILEANVQNFKNSPKTRAELGRVLQLMVKLQNDVASLYGPSFSVTEHIGRYIASREAFTSNLPPLVMQPDYRFFDDRDSTIREIRSVLQPLGLTSF